MKHKEGSIRVLVTGHLGCVYRWRHGCWQWMFGPAPLDACAKRIEAHHNRHTKETHHGEKET